MKRILVAASFERGRGTGHLVRSARLVHELRGKGFEARLCVQGDRGWRGIGRLAPFLDRNSLIASVLVQQNEWDLVVTDRFRTPQEELVFYKSLAPVLGIDEGGKARAHFDFLLDILQQSGGASQVCLPNEKLPLLAAGLVPKKESAETSSLPLNALVTFGGEDRAKLGFKTCVRLLGTANISLTPMPARIRAPALREALFSFDLVITHYGLTAYEALAAEVPVLLGHPSAQHRGLAEKAGFWPLSKLPSNDAAEWVRDVLKPYCAELSKRYQLEGAPRTLADYIAAMSPKVFRKCPACGGAEGHLVVRYPGRNYKKCPDCGMIFMERENEPPIEYSDKYFFDDYKKQYGKTYLEDFQHLKELAKERVSNIKEILDAKTGDTQTAANSAKASRLKLLDVGSAYGPFLAAAKEAGFFMPIGFDPSENAVRYTKEQLGIFALKGFFPDDCKAEESAGVSFWEKNYFDAVSMWFVIEHFSDLKAALEKAALLLQKGGVFAFSTPSFSGVSALFSKKTFLKNSPADHWTIWPPSRVNDILKKYGFAVKKVIITGHHPERFPRWTQVFGKKALLRLSQDASLGDTFEAYAVKTGASYGV